MKLKAPPPVDRASLQAKLKRLARLYADGLRSDYEYEKERDALHAQLDVLGGVPGILRAADITDRRAVLKTLFSEVILESHLATKAKARDDYRELLRTLDKRSGLRVGGPGGLLTSATNLS